MPARRMHFEYLSDDELTAIEETSYRLLDEVGISLQHPQAVEMLHGLGCRVERGRVFIPPDVVRWAIANVTPQKELHSLDGRYSIPLGDGALRFHNGGGPPNIYDWETDKRRPSTADDLASMTRLLDALPNVDEITVLFSPQEVPPALMSVVSTSVLLRNTRKPVSGPAAENPDDARVIIEMAAACAGGMEALRQRPFLTLAVSPVSPLIFTDKVTSAIMAIAEAGIPFHSLPAPSLGATGPITLAGCLAQQHAEVLASFVIVAAHPARRARRILLAHQPARHAPGRFTVGRARGRHGICRRHAAQPPHRLAVRRRMASAPTPASSTRHTRTSVWRTR